MTLPIADEPGTTLGVTKSGVERRFIVRDILTADRTYYVREDGSDASAGRVNTAAGAFRTITKAINNLATIDFNGFDVTIQVANGTYRETCLMNESWLGGGHVFLQGDINNPANVLILPPTGDAVKIDCYIAGYIVVQGFRLMAKEGNGLVHSGTGQVYMGNMVLDECFTYHITAFGSGAYLRLASDYKIIGSALSHIVSDSAGFVDIGDITVTAVGELEFLNFVASTRRAGIDSTATFDAPDVSGTRYFIDSNGMIFTSGSGSLYFPGSSNGILNTGGRYV